MGQRKLYVKGEIMLSKLEKQRLESTIIHKDALIERLRARLCGEDHDWIKTSTEWLYGANGDVDTIERRVCRRCEKVEESKHGFTDKK